MKKELLVLTAAAAMMFALPVTAGAGPNPQKGPDGQGPRAMMMFEAMDADSDGKVTEAEFTAHAQERFAKIDKDGDGSVTKEEAQAAHAAMHEKMKEKREEWRQKRMGAPDAPAPDATEE